MSGTAEQARAAAQASVEGYSEEHRPLAGYSVLTAVFGVGFVAALAAAQRRRGKLPERYGLWDLVTIGAATHKLSRLIAKDKVTSALRAPFVRYEEPDGHGEVSEEPRGSGLRMATGELLICPYCVGQWVAAGFGVGMVGMPELTRLVAFIYSAETVADFLQLAYKAAEDATSS
ncbi:MAG TPA: DUF1360 domain-containing protein [Solirubrobacterales bacterium]|nr:DUF1360 domain-containing protein [Solirubrobacterales bacterium]